MLVPGLPAWLRGAGAFRPPLMRGGRKDNFAAGCKLAAIYIRFALGGSLYNIKSYFALDTLGCCAARTKAELVLVGHDHH